MTPSIRPKCEKAPAEQVGRALTRDGRFTARRIGGSRLRMDFYHRLMSMSWPWFILGLAGSYLLLNLLFATLYFLGGPETLNGTDATDELSRFASCFFFSVQTFATIGYGRITPTGTWANLVVVSEAWFGLLSVALATGLLFARFSRPTSRVIFSERAVLDHVDGVFCLMFRIANERTNQIVDATVKVVLLRFETTKEGSVFRNLYDLKLEREHSPIFANTWTVVHEIDSTSPLYGLTLADWKSGQLELIVSLIGIDDTFSQNVHARYSYTSNELVWNARFDDMLIYEPGGTMTIDLARINQVTPRTIENEAPRDTH